MLSNMKRFADIAEAMGENIIGLLTVEAAEKAIAAIQRLSADVGIPSGLKELGVKEEVLKIMAENAQKDAIMPPGLPGGIIFWSWRRSKFSRNADDAAFTEGREFNGTEQLITIFCGVTKWQ